MKMKNPRFVTLALLAAVAFYLAFFFYEKQEASEFTKLALQSRLDRLIKMNESWSEYAASTEAEAPTVARIGGPFSLIDQNGIAVTDAHFRGDYMLVYFGYTYCPDICPIELQIMTDAIQALGADGYRVQPIFITVDPERDSVARMAEYVERFHPSFVALTGSRDQIDAVSEAYRVYHGAAADQETSLDPLIDHTSYVFLMGPDGEYLTHFESGEGPETIAEIIRDYL